MFLKHSATVSLVLQQHIMKILKGQVWEVKWHKCIMEASSEPFYKSELLPEKTQQSPNMQFVKYAIFLLTKISMLKKISFLCQHINISFKWLYI